MTAKYWIKLYHEILHDRKMAMLDNRIWRRAIECFLFAGEVDSDGYLPKLADMAWILHVNEEELETDMNELVRVGILEYRDGLYFVRKFADRQKPMDKAEYMRRKRNDEQLQTYYQPVTNGNADKIRIDKIREEPEQSAQAQGDIFKVYEQNIGAITPRISELILRACDDYPTGWLHRAIEIATENNARRWSYIEAILKRWQTDGFDNGKLRPKIKTLEDKLRDAGYEVH